jgi:hypothetical protein
LRMLKTQMERLGISLVLSSFFALYVRSPSAIFYER